MAKIGCTDSEIALLVGMHVVGFAKRKKRDKELRTALEEARADGCKTLRRLQWHGAKKGNATMLVWLGKQMLGQRDQPIDTAPTSDAWAKHKCAVITPSALSEPPSDKPEDG